MSIEDPTPIAPPRQPVVIDEDGTPRYQMNSAVRWLLDQVPQGLNAVALQGFCDEDQTQLAQLIGYSVSGAGGLSYFDPAVTEWADGEAERLFAAQALVPLVVPENRAPRYLTPKQAADILHLSPRTLEGMRHRGDGPKFAKLGLGRSCRILYRRDLLDQWVADQLRSSNEEG